VSKHRARRNWMPLVAGSVALAVTGGIIVGFTIAAGGSPSLAAAPAAMTPAMVTTTSVPPTSAAPAALPADSRRAAYLEALNKVGIPTMDEPTLLLIASGVCAQHQVSTAELSRQVLTLFPGRWTAKDVNTLVDCAKMFFC
jgi:hypothetical protein